MHTHFSAMGALSAFFAVIILGTLWRLAASHMMNSNRPGLVSLGQAMVFQY